MVDEEYNRLQARAGLDTPARNSVLAGAEFLGEAPPPASRRVLADAMPYGKAKNVRAVKGPDIEAVFNRKIGELFAGRIGVSDFITQTCEEVTPLF